LFSVEGKQVLYFAPRFFGYHTDIAEEFLRRGAVLDSLPDRVFDSPLMTGVTKLRRSWVIPAANKFYRDSIQSLGKKQYDLVFVVNGQTLSREFLQELRSSYPTAKFVLYMWDAVKNRQSVKENLNLFDFCFTFDLEDAENYKMIFRPLFFSKGFEENKDSEILYDISFVGTAHTDRYEIVKAVAAVLPEEMRQFWYLYLQAPWVFYYYKLTNPGFKNAVNSEFHFKPMTKEAVQSIFFASKSILDIEHPEQNGLTIRTIETLGSSKKLITTNKKISQYDFFSTDNICIIDRNRPQIPAKFFSTAYKTISPEIYAKYSLKGWLDEIFHYL
jgi:hypothetical protein